MSHSPNVKNHSFRNAYAAMLLTAALTLLASTASAENWPSWRGPEQNGSTSETNLPEKWSLTENVLWQTPLPGLSAATPIVWGDRLFLTTSVRESKDVLARCYNQRSGKLLWEKNIVDGDRQPPRNTLASPSPVTDGKSVFFLFGTGDLTALDFDGNLLWSRKLEETIGRLSLKYGYSSSPLLHQGKLYIVIFRNEKSDSRLVQVDAPLKSLLLCVDAATGKDLWKHERPTDAIKEAFDAYTTPILHEAKGRAPEVVIVGGDYVTAHSPQSGAETWRQAYTEKKWVYWRLIPSLVSAGDLVVGVQPRGGHRVYAFQPADTPLRKFSDAAWTFGKGVSRDRSGEANTPDVCTPLYYQGRLYVLDGRKKVMNCLDPKTGNLIWQGDIGGATKYYASPTAGDGKIYCVDMKGEAVVLAAGDELKVLSRASMNGGSSVSSSIAIANGALFIRTDKVLYCIKNTPTAKP